MNFLVGNCDVHNKREVVAEIKLHNRQVILLCYAVLKGGTRSIVQKLSDDLEDDRQSNPKSMA